MKQIAILLFITTACLAINSCSADSSEMDNQAENGYTFAFGMHVLDPLDSTNKLSDSPSENTYCKEDITIESLQKDDMIRFDFELNSTYKHRLLKIYVSAERENGESTHNMVIKWKKNGWVSTDTVLCEISKVDKTISINNLLFNKQPLILAQNECSITKRSFDILQFYDANDKSTRVEREVDGFTFRYWLTDKDGRETTVFDMNDIKENGFVFHISMTNNREETVYLTNSFGQSISAVYDTNHQFKGRSCQQFPDIYLTYPINPGETQHETLIWCPYNETVGGADKLLSAGTYYTFVHDKQTYFIGYKNGSDSGTRYTVEIPPMFLNFEVQ